MAQPDNTRKSTFIQPQNSPGSKVSRIQTSSHSHRPLLGEGSGLSFKSSSKSRKNHDHDHDHDDGNHENHHHKKSVFRKFKEKARKLKKSLSGRKHREENELRSPYATPPESARAVDDIKERPEYFGSPLYKSAPAPATNKMATKEHSQETNKDHKSTSDADQPKKQERQSTVTWAQSTTDISSSGSTDHVQESNDSKLSALTISTREATGTAPCDGDANKPENGSEAKENTRSSQQPQDKGISVKEYLMHKLEPGEDERALSQVITQTISPKCVKMREAVNSLLRHDEPSQSASQTSNSENDASDSSRDVGASSSTESTNAKSSSLANSSNLSHSLESDLSNASNVSRCSTSTSTSQNQNLGSSSNLEPDSGPNRSNSSPNPSSSPSSHTNKSDNATRASGPTES